MNKTANYYGLDYVICDDGTIIGPERGIVKQRKNIDGYMECTLGSMENRHARVKVHRIIAEQFVPNPLGLNEVNHKDFNRTNNNADNLEWVSHTDNIKYSVDAGHWVGKRCGEINGRAKTTAADVLEMRRLYADGSRISDIAKMYNKPHSTVLNIVKRNTWRNI